MKRFIKLIIVCLTTLSLFACSGNRLVDDDALKNINKNDQYKFLTDEYSGSGSLTMQSSGIISDFNSWLAYIVDSDVNVNSRLVCAFEIEDDSVKDDEILLDLYGPKRKDGQGKISYYRIEDGVDSRVTLDCPVVNLSLDKDGQYYIFTTANEYEGFTDVKLEYGKHYVFTYAPISFIIDTYYNY